MQVFWSTSTDFLVGSRGSIIFRPSHLDLDVPVSVHPAPDILSLRFCSCEGNRDMIYALQQGQSSSANICWRKCQL